MPDFTLNPNMGKVYSDYMWPIEISSCHNPHVQFFAPLGQSGPLECV